MNRPFRKPIAIASVVSRWDARDSTHSPWDGVRLLPDEQRATLDGLSRPVGAVISATRAGVSLRARLSRAARAEWRCTTQLRSQRGARPQEGEVRGVPVVHLQMELPYQLLR